jgi:hypothetical protein
MITISKKVKYDMSDVQLKPYSTHVGNKARFTYQSSSNNPVACPCSTRDDLLHFPTSRQQPPLCLTNQDPDPEEWDLQYGLGSQQEMPFGHGI